MKNSRPQTTDQLPIEKFVVAVNKCETEKEIYVSLAKLLPELIQADRASVALVNAQDTELEVFTLSGESGLLSVGKTLPIDNSVVGISFRLKTVGYFEYKDYPEMVDSVVLRRLGLESAIIAPLVEDGAVVGTINTASTLPNMSVATSIYTMQTISSVVSSCLERLKLIRKTSRAADRARAFADRMRDLTSVSLNLTRAFGTQEMLEIVWRAIGKMILASRVSYAEIDFSNDQFKVLFAGAVNKDMSKKYIRPLKNTAIGHVAMSGHAIFCKDLAVSELKDHELMRALGLKCAWSMPIYAEGKVVGVLNASTEAEPEYADEIFVMLQILANLTSAAKERIDATDALRRQAFQDSLTKLQNRSSFTRKLDRFIRLGKPFALSFVDLDKFKEINDFYGHQVGDIALQQTAKVLLSKVDDGEYVARLGGDEFAILTLGDYNASSDATYRERFKDDSVNFEFRGHKLDVGFSVGTAFFPKDADNKTDLMKYADLALYSAKDCQKSNVCLFEKALAVDFNDRLNLLNAFRSALTHDQIVPFYQPLVSLETGKVIGLEALMRWDHPERGILVPSNFKAIFSDTSICTKLGHEVVKKVTKDMGEWKRQKIDFHKVGINVEVSNLVDSTFFMMLLNEMAKNKLYPGNITLEVTENSIIGPKNSTVIKILQDARKAGIGIALDDFGTGFSSITHLRQLPIDTLKFDRSYVSKLTNKSSDFAIVKALVGLARDLNFSSVAEGIETTAELQALRMLNCDIGQGYLFAKPAPASQIPEIIDRINDTKYTSEILFSQSHYKPKLQNSL